MVKGGRATLSDYKGLAQRRPAVAGCCDNARQRRCCGCCVAKTGNGLTEVGRPDSDRLISGKSA
jgi:hypothetical protein